MKDTNNEKKPGVVVYFADYEMMLELEPLDRCKIYDSIIEYSQFGVIPEFDKIELRIIWKHIKPHIDYDNEQYRKKCIDNAYKIYKRWQAEKNLPVLEKEQWYTTVYNGIQQNTTEYQSIPNTNTESNTDTKTKSETNTKSNSDTDPNTKGVQGETATLETELERLKAEKRKAVQADNVSLEIQLNKEISILEERIKNDSSRI